MLVDPVRRQPADDALVPPRGLGHLLPPRPAGVPVVADVVVVEDHRARQCRQQPAVLPVAPRDPVEVGVLLEVLELLPRRLVEAAPRADELPHHRAGLVGVDLVAQEQHEVRPARGLVGRHVQRVGAQRVDAELLGAGVVVRHADPARAERHPQRLARLEGRHDRRRERRPGLGPQRLPRDAHDVRRVGAGLEPRQLHQGVVVAVGREGAGGGDVATGGDGHRRCLGDLDPDRSGGLVDVPQQRPQHEGGHGRDPCMHAPGRSGTEVPAGSRGWWRARA